MSCCTISTTTCNYLQVCILWSKITQVHIVIWPLPFQLNCFRFSFFSLAPFVSCRDPSSKKLIWSDLTANHHIVLYLIRKCKLTWIVPQQPLLLNESWQGWCVQEPLHVFVCVEGGGVSRREGETRGVGVVYKSRDDDIATCNLQWNL